MRPERIDGIRAAFGFPGFAIFANMVGFAAIAREAGFDIAKALATTFLVWGMPGQVAMATLHATGASLIVIFTGVALANLRMLLMTISIAEMLSLHRRGFGLFRKIANMQMVAITAWAQIGIVHKQYEKEALFRYFTSFGITIYALGMSGTVFGYYLSDFVNEEILRAVLVITPLYILLMVINAGRRSSRIAAFAGGAVCPLLHPLLGEWAILAGGIAAGSAVMFARRIINTQRERQSDGN